MSGKNYKYVSGFRNDKAGGGFAIIFRNCYDVTALCNPYYISFEYVSAKFHCKLFSFTITVVYRSPSLSLALFLEEFDNFLELCNNLGNHIILGDFNIHMNCGSEKNVRNFLFLFLYIP